MGIHECECTEGFVAVADGVGGNNAGAVASQFVAEELGKCDHMIKNLTEINRKLIECSRADEAFAGMATTLAMVDFTEDSAKITYVGNTRVYAIVNGKYLKQLTRDDTTLEYLLATGQLDSFTAESFERKNEITACFGAGSPVLLKLKQIDISGQDTLIVTSDGIHDYVSIDEMEDIYCAADDKVEFCKKLIDQAVENGSVDDASVMVLNK
jgi:serine/threonine protein phosphatase PrpC